MPEVCDLKDRSCVPCQGGTPPLAADESAELKADLHADWQLDAPSKMLTRRFEFKVVAKAS